ncbi:MAG: hypothetical protein IJV22_02020 [Bacteroidales bacterium]|nr:hypothetical protein [Bacteroidales bacterium]
MKKAFRILTSLVIVVGLMGVCGVCSSCKSSKTMYTPKSKSGKVINRNYKVKGNNQRNSATYRTY